MTNQLFLIKDLLEHLNYNFPTDFIIYKKCNKQELGILEESIGVPLAKDLYDFFNCICSHFQNSGGLHVKSLKQELKNISIGTDLPKSFIFNTNTYNSYKNEFLFPEISSLGESNYCLRTPFISSVDEDDLFPFLYEICTVDEESSYFTPLVGALKGSIWLWNSYGFFPELNENGDLIYFLDWIEIGLKKISNELLQTE